MNHFEQIENEMTDAGNTAVKSRLNLDTFEKQLIKRALEKYAVYLARVQDTSTTASMELHNVGNLVHRINNSI